jgi:hypothetical protein
MTLNAIAYASGMTNSSVAMAIYNISVAGTTWYNSAWTNRKAVTDDHSKVSGNLANFPILFSVTDANLKTVANGGQVGRSDGGDILFTSADGVTKLDHELESYNGSNGQVSAWVGLPAVSSTTDTVIYVYYGNTSALAQQNPAGVWDSDYKLVWHLGDGTTLNPTDSTGNHTDGVSDSAAAAAGKIVGGAAGVVEATGSNLVTGDQSRTLECWFQITDRLYSDQTICGMGYDNGTGSMFSLMYRANSTLSLDAMGIAQSFPWTADSNWHHLAASYTKNAGLQNAAVYLDGVQQATTGDSGTLASPSPSYFDIQHNPAYPWSNMTGTVDEFRVSGTTRSGAWITTEYNNQNSPGSFVKLGSQESPNSAPVAQVATPAVALPGGSYSSTQAVAISTATAGASIRYTTDGTTPSSTVGTTYSGPVSVSSSLTLKAISYKSGMTDSSVSTTTYTITAATTGGVAATGSNGSSTAGSGPVTVTGSGNNSVAFVKTDTATQGNWKGVYGADGYNVIDDTISYPGYAVVRYSTPAWNSIWASSTGDVRGLQKASSSTDRIAAQWYTYNSFTIDLNFTDGAQHQLAVYCVDWDSANGRSQTLSILDGATNAVLDTQNVTNFHNGKYVVWNLKGHVVLRVTNTALVASAAFNGTITGLFFDPAAPGSTVATLPVVTPAVQASTFNLPAGGYGAPQSVTISTARAGASIRYTTDGTTPTSTAGTVYNGPVSVSSSLTLKAIAYAAGMTDSAVTWAATPSLSAGTQRRS